MYRTEKLATKLKKNPLQLDPICIASYSRPDAVLLGALKQNNIFKGSLLFVRKEEYEIYEKWSDFFKIIKLKGVDNIGDTRRVVVNYCVAHGIDNMYLLDDDITEVQYLVPMENSKGVEYMKTYSTAHGLKKSIDPIAFMIWQYLINNKCDKQVVISAPVYRPFSWSSSHKNKSFVYNAADCIQCVRLNIKLLHDNNINYRSTKLIGPSDYALQFDCMSNGLKTIQFKDLEYDAQAMGSGSGGCSASEYNILFNGDMDKVMQDRYERFMTNVCGYDHPGIRTKITAKTKRISPAFNWKYWRSLSNEQS